MPTYHRLESPTQTKSDAATQLQTYEIWGQPIVGTGIYPCVKAYLGALPSTATGIQFETDVVPNPHPPYPGANVYWYEAPHGNASPASGRPGWCCLRVRHINSRYA